MIATFVHASSILGESGKELPGIALAGLSDKPAKADTWLLQWMLGLTGKSVQNVLRGDRGSGGAIYLENHLEAIDETAALVLATLGELTGRISLEGDTLELDWATALHLTTAIGAQTLAIRGSEKSMYGKLFEPLVLGSALHILGFQLINYDDIRAGSEHVFWLASRNEKRESDATALISSGRGVRFDIGFIGKGNPEITLDKVSRFEREVQFGRKTWFLATMIVVDTIPAGSRLLAMADQIDGTVVQMSMSYWPKSLAIAVRDRTGYEAAICRVPDSDLPAFIAERLASAPIAAMLRLDALEDIEISPVESEVDEE